MRQDRRVGLAGFQHMRDESRDHAARGTHPSHRGGRCMTGVDTLVVADQPVDQTVTAEAGPGVGRAERSHWADLGAGSTP